MKTSRSLFLAVLGGAPIAAAWTSPACHATQGGNFLPFTRTTGSRTDGTSREKRRALLVLAADRDNAMDAYEQAMRKMTAAKPPPAATATAAVVAPSTSTAVVSDNPPAPTQKGNGMHAYEQYFQNVDNQNSNLPPQPYGGSTSMNGGTGNPPPFLESTLNDPTWSAQEKSALETAKTWTTTTTTTTTTDSASTNFAPPFAYPKEEEQSTTEQEPPPPPSLQETTTMNSFEAQYASFMQALAPNSETKIPPPPAVALEDWAPALDLGSGTTTDTDTTTKEEEAQVQPPKPQPDEPPPVTPTIRETQMQPTPYIPSLRKKTDDFAVVAAEREAVKDAALNIASSFSATDRTSESFLSTTWEELGAQKKTSFATTNTAAETIVKPGVTKRIFESLDFDGS